MKLIDLHCDTLYKSVTQNMNLDNSSYETKLAKKGDNKLQCYAIWLPDDLDGDSAEKLFFTAAERLKSECIRCNINLMNSGRNLNTNFFTSENNAFFTVENGLALNGKLENVKRFSELGVKIMTLTWNAHNYIGDGSTVKNPKGITPFGKQAIKEMEKYGIVIDVSHASDALFYDVSKLSQKPFIATHSDSRTVTPHKRNLTDEQFKIIKEKKGLVGLNFHNAFLNSDPNKASITDILRHAEHFLSLGGENILAIGSDFDGCSLPNDIKGSESMSVLFELFLKHNYNESLVNKIFYENALKFFENFDI
ncbi:MAG: membrane dipeptidase [Ruminococcus sp.]|nr:membrane dipeptidase [Ruminococcus sp.]